MQDLFFFTQSAIKSLFVDFAIQLRETIPTEAIKDARNYNVKNCSQETLNDAIILRIFMWLRVTE